MTGTLALVGSHSFAEVASYDRSLIEASGADEVLILPTAAAYEHPARGVESAVGALAGLGVMATELPVLARADALDHHHADALRTARCIYLLGGSALHARSVLTQSPVWEAVVAAFDDGATIVGSGAGAQVLCDPMIDERGGAFTVGLGLVERLAVLTGRNHWSVDALHRTRELAAPDLVVLGIDDGTAAIRNPDGSWRAEGQGIVEVHIGGAAASISEVNR